MSIHKVVVDDDDDDGKNGDDLDQLQVFELGDKVSSNPGGVEEPLSVGLVEHLAYQVTLLCFSIHICYSYYVPVDFIKGLSFTATLKDSF